MTLGANSPNHLYLGILGLKTRNGMAKIMPEKSTGGALAKTSEAASSKDFPHWWKISDISVSKILAGLGACESDIPGDSRDNGSFQERQIVTK